MCRLVELQDGTYSLKDLVDMHSALDALDDIRWEAAEKAKREAAR